MKSTSYFTVTLIVAVPFLISMIILYIFFLSTKGWGESEDIYGPYNIHCGYKQVAGILKRTYHDDYDTVDFQCTGLILGENIVVTPLNLTSDLTYNVSSGSEYWSRDHNLHRIIRKTPLRSLMVYEVEPDFPKCIHEDKVIIAKKVDRSYDYEMIGWEGKSRLMLQRIQRFAIPPNHDASCKLPGSILKYTKSGNIFGMSTKSCDGLSVELVDIATYIGDLKSTYTRLFNIAVVE